MIRKFNKYSLFIIGLVFTLFSSFLGYSEPENTYIYNDFPNFYSPGDTAKNDTSKKKKFDKYVKSKRPTYESQDRYEDQFSAPRHNSSLDAGMPSNINMDFTPDDSLKNYEVSEKIGDDLYFRTPTTMTFEQFQEYQKKQQINNYWNQISTGEDGGDLGNDRLIPKIALNPGLDKIFGGNFVDIRPNGAVTLKFGGKWQRTFNPALPKQQQRYGFFDFDQNITLNLNGSIGEKMKVSMNWNTGAQFDFQNNVKLDYTGFDHEIIQDIDAGNISMPLPTQLITAGQNLFGLKTELKFGRLYWTTAISTVRSSVDEIEVENGAQNRSFNIKASDYEDNKHFFLGHFFRERYERAFTMPNITSDVRVTRVEVFVLNLQQRTENLRNVAAFLDLGEPEPYQKKFGGGEGQNASNNVNTLYSTLVRDDRSRDLDGINNLMNEMNLEESQDYVVKSSMRKLEPSDFDFHPQLGYISLNSRLQNNEVLAVAYEYSVNGNNYKVGELFDDYQNFSQDDLLILKMLRPANINTNLPTWDLMMKNVYSLGTSQVNQDNFRMRVVYKDDRTGVDNPSLVDDCPIKDVPLVRVMNLDNLNQNGDRQPDSNFDFIDNGGVGNFYPVTIDARRGRIYFPVLEPFGEHLKKQLGGNPTLERKYVYDKLYNGTKNDAQQQANKDKFILSGSFQSASSNEIMLNAISVEEGSVKVMSGSTPLVEGVDYTVNYSLGRVKILNQGVLNSGKKIKVQFEKQNLLNFRPKTLFANRWDYRFSDDFVIGATLLRLTERPFWNKINTGDEPVNNMIWGADINYSTESRLLTKMVDKIPLINTKEISTISASGEFAQIIPGHANGIEVDNDDNGVAYVDDFEGTESSYLLSGNIATARKWRLASTPVRFRDQQRASDLSYGYGRSKLAWYTIDRGFYFGFAGARPELPEDETGDDANDFVKRVFVQDVFPGRSQNQVDNQMYTLDLAYFPNERGQYNYDTSNIDAQTGKFTNPEDRWAGVMRANEYDVDFDNANVEYIEFWLMDPFNKEFNIEDDNGNPVKAVNTRGGKLYLNIGNISEDLMKDNRYSFENGLPTNSNTEDLEQTVWGNVTKNQYITDGFSNTEGTREKQDIGLDGLNSIQEADFFSDYLNALPGGVANEARNDPSSDDFEYFLSEDFDDRQTPIIQRYKNFNNLEGNSPEGAGVNSRGYTTLPDKEDLDRDNTISTAESYYEYEVDLTGGLQVGNGYIVDRSPDGNWYQFRIPIRDPNGRSEFGGISGFKSIRFMRMYLTGWSEPVVLRMAQFQYVEAQWRRVLEDLSEDNIGSATTPENTFFNISSVNIEENGGGDDGNIPYVLPPGVQRQQNFASVGGYNTLQNEQSLNLCVEDLKAGDARGVFKNTSFDFINYTNLRMFVHAHSETAEDNEVTAFIRVGIDKHLNYYEYEMPLKMTPFEAVDDESIWPEENRMDVPLKKLIELKDLRGNDYSYDSVYTFTDESGNKMRIKGNPDMREVNVLMLGIKNPGTGRDINGNVIGDDKDVCVWFNELRMNGFNEKGGWAAIGNVNTRLADFATVNVSGSHTSIGFGAVHQTLNQRARESTTSYDVNSTILLNKFLPKKWNIQLPMYVGYDQTTISPEYDPLKPDVNLKKSINSIEDAEEREEYKKMTQDITTRKSINFTNVKKNRSPEAKIKTPLDISNFAVSYAYTEQEHFNVNTESDLETRRTGTLNYGYSPKPLSFEPFKKLKPAYLQMIKDINFNPVPNNFTFRAELNRFYNEEQLRTIGFDNKLTTEGIDPNFDKKINFRRQYSFRWNLTKSLSFDYSANTNAAVDERAGRISKEDEDYNEKLDVIRTNIADFGRTTNFDQNATINYKVPIDKIPLLDWVTANTSYKSNYSWSSGPVTISEQGFATADSLGNTIQNGNTKTLNGSLNFEKLYNKSKYLKSINNPRKSRSSKRTNSRSRTNSKDEEDEDEEEKKDLKGMKMAIRSLMMVRSFNYNLSVNEGTMLPGYLGDIRFIGMDRGFNYPGYPFIAGIQNDTVHKELARDGMLTESYYFNKPMSYNTGFNGSYKLTLEPFNDFKVTVDAQHNWNNSNTFIYKDTLRSSNEVQFVENNAMNTGTFSTSFVGISTFFENGLFIGDSISPTFEKFAANRDDIQQKLNDYNQNDEDTARYGLNSQDVLIPAFLRTYSGKDINEFDPKIGERNIFSKIPLPNWKVNYRGLSKVKFFKKWFTSINLTHGYSGTYNVSGYNTSLEYSRLGEDRFTGENYYNHQTEGANVNIQNENTKEYIPYYLITQVVVQERMSPLIGVDFRTKSKMSFKVSYDKTRSLSLSMTNAQVTEMRSDKLNFTFGFSKKGLIIKPKFLLPYIFNKGREIVFPNEMNFKIGLSYTNNTTDQRFLEDLRNVPTGGAKSIQFNPTIDYDVSKRLNIQLYFTRRINDPRISTAYKNTSTEVGGQVKFNLN